MSRPILAVDIDGVISLFGFDEPPPKEEAKFELVDGMVHCISLLAGDRLRRLADHYELVWASGWEKLQIIPILVVTPLAFLGGSFYSISMLPPLWQKLTLFNPVVYLISGFRWAFYGISDVSVGISLGMTFLFMAICIVIVWWIFKTGYRLKA